MVTNTISAFIMLWCLILSINCLIAQPEILTTLDAISCEQQCIACLNQTFCLDNGPNCIWQDSHEDNINESCISNTHTPQPTQSISCNKIFDGDYIEPALFQLSLSTPQMVTFDGCNSTSEPNIQIYSIYNEENILNECGFESNCCNVPFTTNLSVGTYIFVLQLDESLFTEQDIFEYIIDVTCSSLTTISTTIYTTKSPKTTNETFIDNETDDNDVAFWVWIIITISGSCWIFIVIALIKRKKQRTLRGMTIHSEDMTISDVNKTSKTYHDVNNDDHDEQMDEELQRFMDEQHVDENY